MAYVMAHAVGADAGLINGGGIRDGLKAGPITNRDIYGVLPFQNLIMKYLRQRRGFGISVTTQQGFAET